MLLQKKKVAADAWRRNSDETARQVHDALVNGQIMLIDVREPAEFAVERIGGAVLCPLSTLDPLRLPLEVGKAIDFQCGSGKRSEHAHARAVQAGLAVRGDVGGGIGARKAAGLPTLTVDPPTGAVQDRK